MGKIAGHICSAVCGLLLLGKVGLGGLPAEEQVPMNLFDMAPVTTRYDAWWRPMKTNFEKAKVMEIKAQIESVPDSGGDLPDAEAIFGANSSSAFIFPVLATQGEKGAMLLEGYLGLYAGRRILDDRWLLVIAALGHNATLRSQTALEAELDRVSKEYDFGKETRTADALAPIVDALLAGMARRRTLAAESIDRLVEKAPHLAWFAWVAGLEWVQLHMSRRSLLDLIEEGLAGCDRRALRLRLDGGVAPDRLRAIEVFLSYSPTEWAVAKELVLRNQERETILFEYLLFEYATILVNQADLSKGSYEIDKAIADLYLGSNIGDWRNLGALSAILLECAPSREFAGWKQFLERHAAHLDPRDKEYVDYMVERIHREIRRPGERALQGTHVYQTIMKPGVHLRGFAASGGLRPGEKPTEHRPQ